MINVSVHHIFFVFLGDDVFMSSLLTNLSTFSRPCPSLSEIIVQHVHTITRALRQHRANEFIRITNSTAIGDPATTSIINFNRIGWIK
jgi:hypothetical protein